LRFRLGPKTWALFGLRVTASDVGELLGISPEAARERLMHVRYGEEIPSELLKKNVRVLKQGRSVNREAIGELLAKNIAVEVIARELGVSSRTVRYVRAGRPRRSVKREAA
jgi:FixJ family two-component response regulator